MDYSKKIFNLLSEAGTTKSGITDAQTKKIFYDNGGITDKKLRELQEKKRRELELRSRLLDQDPIINKKINLHLENQNQEPSSDNYNYGFVQPSEQGLFGLAGFGSNKFGIEGTIGGYVPYDFVTNPYFKGNYFANAQKHFPKVSVGIGANKEIFGYPDQSGNFTRVASGISPNFNLRFNFQEGGSMPKYQVGGEEKNGEKEKLWDFTEPEYPYAPSTIIDDVEVSESTKPVLNLSQEGKDQMANEIADWVSAKENIKQTGLDYSDLAVRVINYPRNWQGSNVPGVGKTYAMLPGHIEAVIINKNTGEIVEGLTPINRWANTDAKDVNFSALGYEGVRYVDLELDPLQLETFLTEAKKFKETDYSNLSEEQEKFYEDVFTDGVFYPGSFGTGSPDEYDLFRSNCADGVCRGLGIADSDALETAFGATDPELVFDYIINSGDYKYDTAYGEKGPTNLELVQDVTGLSSHSSELIADWAEGLTEADLASLEKHVPYIYNKYYKGVVDYYNPEAGFLGLLHAIAASPQGTIPLLSQVLVQEGLIEPVKKHFTDGSRIPFLMPGKYKEGGNISQMGYRDDSPYRDRDYIDIETKNGLIDMSNTGKTLLAHDEYGNAKVLPPYSGLHKFLGHRVREYNLDKYKF